MDEEGKKKAMQILQMVTTNPVSGITYLVLTKRFDRSTWGQLAVSICQLLMRETLSVGSLFRKSKQVDCLM
jgi:hypothetical protein